MNVYLVKYENLYKKNHTNRSLSHSKFPQQNGKIRFEILINFLNVYLISNGMEIIEQNYDHIKKNFLLYVSSNLIVASFLKNNGNPELFKPINQDLLDTLSIEYRCYLALDCDLTHFVCQSHRELLKYLDLNFPELEKNLLTNKKITSALNRLNEIKNQFGSKYKLIISNNFKNIIYYFSPAA